MNYFLMFGVINKLEQNELICLIRHILLHPTEH